MSKVTIVIFLFFIGSCIAGVQNLYVSLTNWNPTEISCAEFLEKGSSANWLRLTNCYRDNSEVVSVYNQLTGVTSLSKFYLPLRAKPGNSKAPVKLFLKINNKSDVAKFVDFSKAEKKEMTDKDYEVLLKKYPDMMKFLTGSSGHTLMGTVVFGIDSDSDTVDLLRKDGLAVEDFVIIDEGNEPSLGMGIFMCVLSLVFLGVWGYRVAD